MCQVDDAQAVDDMEAGLAPPAAGAVVVDEPGGAPPVVDGDIFPEEFRVLYVERLRMQQILDGIENETLPRYEDIL